MTRRQHCEVVGSQGTIYVANPYVPGTGDVDIMLTVEGETTTIPVPGIDQYQLEVEHFTDCILSDTQPRYAGEDAVKNMRVIEAIYQSGREKKPVTI
jgi:predicted dehydrogenase